MSQNAEELWDKADEMPDGHGKILILQEAARLTDSEQDIELGYDIRKDIIEAGIFSGYPLEAIVAFSWCLAQYDKDPEKFDSYDMLWEYKWIISQIDSFPEVPLDKINEMFEDMKNRYIQNGSSLGPYYSLKCDFHQKMGDKEEASEYFKKWIGSPRDYLSDCNACDINSQIEYQIYAKNYLKAQELFDRMLSKKIGCAEVPHATYSKFLIPFLEIAKYDDARSFHEKGYKMVYKNRTFIYELGNHLLYLAITNIDEAVAVFQKHFQWAFETTSVLNRFNFYLASWVLFERLKKAGHNNLKINLKKDSDIIAKYDLKDTPDVIKWFEEKTREMASRFNQRNGTEHYNERIAQTLKLVDF